MEELSTNERPDVIVLKTFDINSIPPNFHEDYFTHILCHAGSGQFTLGNRTYSLGKGDVVIWLPKTTPTNIMFSMDFNATFLLLSFDLLDRNNPDMAWGIKGYLFSQENPVVTLSSKEYEMCTDNFAAIQKKFEATDHQFYSEVLDCQTQIFVLNMWNILALKIKERDLVSQNSGSLFERFLQLVRENCIHDREVEKYAYRLNITPKYLSEVCKNSSGKTATEWIQKFTVQNIILLLRNKRLTISEISDTMNFSSPSFFSSYVKKNLGLTPTEFRNKLKKK